MSLKGTYSPSMVVFNRITQGIWLLEIIYPVNLNVTGFTLKLNQLAIINNIDPSAASFLSSPAGYQFTVGVPSNVIEYYMLPSFSQSLFIQLETSSLYYEPLGHYLIKPDGTLATIDTSILPIIIKYSGMFFISILSR